jgi:hypothetical protein
MPRSTLCQGTRASFRTALAAMQAGKNGGREPAATQLALPAEARREAMRSWNRAGALSSGSFH